MNGNTTKTTRNQKEEQLARGNKPEGRMENAEATSETKASKNKEYTYGEDVRVETTGDFELYDMETKTDFRSDEPTETKFSRFIEAMVSQGKLKIL